MFVVGLTGGIGSGKSEAAKLFAALGVPVTDVDLIAHQLTAAGQPLLQEIARAFGKEYLLENGALDRKALREKVFSDDSARNQLEAILHPAIHQHAQRELDENSLAAKSKIPYQILVIPLLFEGSRYQDVLQRTLVIDCDESLQISRAMQRNNELSESAVLAIMKAQVPRKKRIELADDVIENNGSLEALKENVLKIHGKYIHTCIVSE
jgi:dephospho-CoA kinase